MLRRVLNEYESVLVEEMVNRYKISFNELDMKTCEHLEQITKRILHATIAQDSNALKDACHDISALNNTNNIPYIVLINELNTLKNRLTSLLVEKEAKEDIFELHKTYIGVENMLAYEHLGNYIEQLMHSNNNRINSIKDLVKKNLVDYYLSHLEWLNQLATAIVDNDSDAIPQLDHALCGFGLWLNTQGKSVISNNSKLKFMVSIHTTLHALARSIKSQMQKERVNFNILLSYLEKCEFISLSIGTELALIDNRILMKEFSTDEMTGALSRNTLQGIFMNQYELAHATSSSFVLALCDLDHFKRINDTYGHLAGDAVLREFVDIVKNVLRDSDIVIRYGGEEFVIILPHTNIENALCKLNSIRENFVRLGCHYEGHQIHTSVSIGAISILPHESYSALENGLECFLHDADRLLYKAKSNGRNQVVVA